MTLNHLNLTVTDPTETSAFLAKYFGLLPGGGNQGMQMLRDDGGMVLTLIKARHEDNADVGLDEGHEGEPTREGRKGRVRYPSSFHIGFIQPSPARVDENQPAAARRRLRRRCPRAAARVVDVLLPGAWWIHHRGVGLVACLR